MTESRRDASGLASLAIGGLGALALGMALVPVREAVSASNLAFLFLAWTIVIAELGGRAAALVTAVVSALSLNFFLTGPYLSLRIHDPGDIGAFVGLAGCGLIAALFGRRRRALAAAAGQAHAALVAVRRAERALERGGPRDARVAAVVADLRESLDLRAIALRTPRGAVAAVSPPDFAVPTAPPTVLEADSLVPRGETPRLLIGPHGGFRLPETGGRLPLRYAGAEVGSLDLWEDAAGGLDRDQIAALWLVARLLAMELAAPAAAAR